MTSQDAIHALRTASVATPVDLKTNGAGDIAVALNLSLGIFALHLKTTSDQQPRTLTNGYDQED